MNAKPGLPYNLSVADIAKAMHPSASIEVSEYIEGPDGDEREVDVSVRSVVEDKPHFLLIECKDWKRPVGVGVIDALDSKRSDLGADHTMIVSNSGFTEPALRKSARINIECLSAVSDGDEVCRFVINRVFYASRISAVRNSITLLGEGHQDNADLREYMMDDRPLAAWIREKCAALLRAHPQANTIRNAITFKEPLIFDRLGETVTLTAILIELECEQGWVFQNVKEDVSNGFYDHIKKAVVVPAKETYSIMFDMWAWEDVVLEVGQSIVMSDIPPNSIKLGLILYRAPFDDVKAPSPNISEFVDQDEINISSASLEDQGSKLS